MLKDFTTEITEQTESVDKVCSMISVYPVVKKSLAPIDAYIPTSCHLFILSI